MVIGTYTKNYRWTHQLSLMFTNRAQFFYQMRRIRSFLLIVCKLALLSAFAAKLPFLKLMIKILQSKLKIAFTEELSMKRYVICHDNPFAIHYRDFSLFVHCNPK